MSERDPRTDPQVGDMLLDDAKRVYESVREEVVSEPLNLMSSGWPELRTLATLRERDATIAALQAQADGYAALQKEVDSILAGTEISLEKIQNFNISWNEADKVLAKALTLQAERDHWKTTLNDTILAIAVDGLGFVDPRTDDAPNEPPEQWKNPPLLSQAVAALRKDRDALQAEREVMAASYRAMASSEYELRQKAKWYDLIVDQCGFENGKVMQAIAALKEQRDKLQAQVEHEKDFRIRSINESAIREQELKAELAEAKRQFNDEGPGTPMGIINAVCDFAEKECGHNGASARHGVSTVMDWVIKAKTQIVALREALEITKPALTEAAQASIESLKHPGRMKELNVHARRALDDIEATLAADPGKWLEEHDAKLLADAYSQHFMGKQVKAAFDKGWRAGAGAMRKECCFKCRASVPTPEPPKEQGS